MTRAQCDRFRGPFDAAVVPHITDRSPAHETSIVITRFDAEFGTEVAPFASILLRSESASSSQIDILTSGAE